MAEPKETIKLAKANVLVVTQGPLWGLRDEPKDRPSHILTLQDAADIAKVYTVKCSQKELPENIKQGAAVENLEFGLYEWGDQQEHRIKFEKPGGGKFGGGGGYRGPSPEELAIKKFAEVSRIVGVAYSYALSVLTAQPEPVTAAKLGDMGDEIADRMWAKAVALKG